MACFVAPAAVAVVTTITRKVVKNKEGASHMHAEQTRQTRDTTAGKWTQRLGWLNAMLWGGSALLCLEHIWHGEVVPWPPFLTAMRTPGQIGPMLHEILVYGTAMTAAILVVWGIMVGVAEFVERRASVTTRLRSVLAPGDKHKLGFLSLIYWGAALMWLVDHVIAYTQKGGQFFDVTASATALASSAVALGLFIWLVRLLLADPGRLARAIGRR